MRIQQELLLLFSPLLFFSHVQALTLGGGDVFSAMVALEDLLVGGEAETTAAIIEQYVQMESERLQQLRSYAKKLASGDYRERNIEAVKNPVNAYLLIKRLIADWKRVKELMMLPTSAEEFIEKINQARMANGLHYPNEDDVEGAAIALLRIQDTYQLDTGDMASGVVAGSVEDSQRMSAQDCFDIARVAHDNQNYFHSLNWAQESLRRIDSDRDSKVHKGDVLDYLAFALYKQGNLDRALAVVRQITEVDPLHPRPHSNGIQLGHCADEQNAADRATIPEGEAVRKNHSNNLHQPADHCDHPNDGGLPPLMNERDLASDIPERIEFERLCRSEGSPVLERKQQPNESVPASSIEAKEADSGSAPPSGQSSSSPPLHCYLKNDRPFLKLAPIKVEIIHHNPLLVLFRGVLSHGEIEAIKQIATPKLVQYGAFNLTSGKRVFNPRISKDAWLQSDLHEVVARLNKRAEMMTNLEQATSEDLHITNYGLGGHYDPHFDFDSSGEKSTIFAHLNSGNRIATLIFYMSEPKGGATVFTELKTGVFPSQHDALFWYNLKRDGALEWRTIHGGCPVLTGFKWIATKWMHEGGQEFRRPCGLNSAVYEKFVGDVAPF